MFAAFAFTLARSVTPWDSGEFLAAIHSLGIPHPPGTPFYVILARVWSAIPLPLEFTTRVNLFSALCAATAVTLLGLLVARWMNDRVAGLAAALCAGGTSTLWLSATEAEAYTPALLVAVVMIWVASAGKIAVRHIALIAFLAGLGWTVHPSALVLLPVALVLVLTAARDEGVFRRALLPSLAAAVLGLSAVVFLLVRAQHDPAINQGNPATVSALWDVVTRAQYADAGMWPRQAPFWLQLGNWLQYADWQFALGLGPNPRPSAARTVVTLLFAALGIVGMIAHRHTERRSWRALTAGFIAASLGLVVYLNFKAGVSFGPNGLAREARERDYFFVASFMLWAAWAGIGATVVARRFLDRRRLATIVALIVAALPVAFNWPLVAERRRDASAGTRAAALAILTTIPKRGVMFAVGDNDTYPLWYAQRVEHARGDVTVVTIPLLGARWYREELQRRYSLFDARATREWRGYDDAIVQVCARAIAQGRPIVMTPTAPDRKLPRACHSLSAARSPEPSQSP